MNFKKVLLKNLSLFVFLALAVLLSSCSLSDIVSKRDLTVKHDEPQQNIVDDVTNSKEGDISAEEKEFNESGRAKAIEDETDMWQIFEDSDAGISLRFPLDVGMSAMHEYPLKLKVEINPVVGLEGTMGFNEETALKNIKYLSEGEYGDDVDWPLTESKMVKELEEVNTQEFMVLSRFEVCDVAFERKLYFFNNQNQIVISLIADRGMMMKDMIKYFRMDEVNCAESLIWVFSRQANFYSDLKNGQGSEFAQRWFDAFDGIVDTIQLTELEKVSSNEATSITRLDVLKGKWKSIDDDKSVIEFTDSEKIAYYEDEELFSDSFDIYEFYNDANDSQTDENGKYIIVGAEEDIFKYEILEISDDVLILIYLPRGNILKYEKYNL